MKEGILLENSSSAITTKESLPLFELRLIMENVQQVLESTGNTWIRIHATLEENGIDTILANPYKTKIIAEAKIKSDKLDARILADLLRADLVYESYVPARESETEQC